MRAAIYCRVSSDAQTVDNQLLELRTQSPSAHFLDAVRNALAKNRPLLRRWAPLWITTHGAHPADLLTRAS